MSSKLRAIDQGLKISILRVSSQAVFGVIDIMVEIDVQRDEIVERHLINPCSVLGHTSKKSERE